MAVGLGSSLGDRRATLELAVRMLAAGPGMCLLRVSRWVRTPPLAGGVARNWFLNGVALFRSELELVEVLQRCVRLEQRAGRRRGRYWGDRPLDLDLLLAEGRQALTPGLVVPHPALARRRFVLEPLLEVWPDALGVGDRPQPAGPRPIPDGVFARGRPLRYLGGPGNRSVGFPRGRAP